MAAKEDAVDPPMASVAPSPAAAAPSKAMPLQKSYSTSSTGVSPPILRKSSSSILVPSASGSLSQSPLASRNPSPTRKEKPASLSHTLSMPPSAASIQRALSASNVAQLSHTADNGASARLARPLKSPFLAENSAQHSASPRLRSPPPQSGPNSRRGSAAKKPDMSLNPSALPASLQSSKPAAITTPTSAPQTPKAALREQPLSAPQSSQPQLQPQSQQVQPGPPTQALQSSSSSSQPQQPQQPQSSQQSAGPTPGKVPIRGPGGKSTLETVQENSTDSMEPSTAVLQANADLRPRTTIEEDTCRDLSASESSAQVPAESGSESTGNKSDTLRARSRRSSMTSSANLNAAGRASKSSAAKPLYPLTSAKARDSSQPKPTNGNMTVETETVQSIPQSALTAGDRLTGSRADNGGSVRLKPSNETIRPKKDRKKADRKPRSVTQGTGMRFFPSY